MTGGATRYMNSLTNQVSLVLIERMLAFEGSLRIQFFEPVDAPRDDYGNSVLNCNLVSRLMSDSPLYIENTIC